MDPPGGAGGMDAWLEAQAQQARGEEKHTGKKKKNKKSKIGANVPMPEAGPVAGPHLVDDLIELDDATPAPAPAPLEPDDCMLKKQKKAKARKQKKGLKPGDLAAPAPTPLGDLAQVQALADEVPKSAQVQAAEQAKVSASRSLYAAALRARMLQADLEAQREQSALAEARLTAQLRAQVQLAHAADQRAQAAEQRARTMERERDEALRQARSAGGVGRPTEVVSAPIHVLAAKLKGTVATKATLQAMGEDTSVLDAEIAEAEERLRRARAERTFAQSNFKREYDKAIVVPITLAAQIIGKIQDFIFLYCHAHGLTSGPELQTAMYFADQLQRQVAARPDGGGGGGNLLGEVRHTAELLWTSHLRFEGMGDHAREFCSLLNTAIREDLEELAAPTAALTRGINALCLQGREGAALAFPVDGQVYRGTGFDDAHRGFFAIGRAYRVPGFLATSFSEGKATEFLVRAQAEGQQPVLWVVRVDPAGEHDPTKRCKHVNFVQHSLVVGESEYLFTAYSIFTVRSVHWGVGGAAHRIELDAASDNRVEAEATHRDDGRWGTPVGSETLPLAPWY